MSFLSPVQSKALRIIFLISMLNFLLDLIFYKLLGNSLAEFARLTSPVITTAIFLVYPILCKDKFSIVATSVLILIGLVLVYAGVFGGMGEEGNLLPLLFQGPALALVGISLISRNLKITMLTFGLGILLNGSISGVLEGILNIFSEMEWPKVVDYYYYTRLVVSLYSIIIPVVAMLGYFIIHNGINSYEEDTQLPVHKIGGNSFFFIFGVSYLFLFSLCIVAQDFAFSAKAYQQVSFLCMLSLMIPVSVFLIKILHDRYFTLNIQPGGLYLLSFIPFVNFITVIFLALDKPVEEKPLSHKIIIDRKKKMNLFVMIVSCISGVAAMVYWGWEQINSIRNGLDAGDFFLYIITVFYIAIQLANLKIAQKSFVGFRNLLLFAVGYYLFQVIAFEYNWMALLPSLVFTIMGSFILYSFFWNANIGAKQDVTKIIVPAEEELV